MDSTAAAWNNLATNIRGVGADEYNAGLGLAKFISEDSVRQRDNAIKDISIRSAKQKEDYLNQPVTLNEALNALSDDPKNPKTVTSVMDMMNTFKYKLSDENNPDPNQILLNSDNKPLSRREVSQRAPQIFAIVKTLQNPFTNIADMMTESKQKMGAQSQGPTLSPEEIKVFSTSTDPNVQKEFAKYSALKTDNDRYQANPELLYNQWRDRLVKAKGFVTSIGGNTELFDGRLKEAETLLAQKDKQSIEQQDYKETTAPMEKATGIKVGTKLPNKELVELGGKVASLQGTQATAAAHLSGVREQLAAGKIDQARNTFFNHLTAEKKLAEESFDKTYKHPMTGEYTLKDEAGNPVDITKVAAEKQAFINKQMQFVYQNAQDMGLAKGLKMDLPGVFKAPPAVRQEFAGMDATLRKEVEAIKDPAFVKNINATRKRASELLKSDDAKQYDVARQLLLDATTSAAKYLETRKKNIPKEISKAASNTIVAEPTVPGRGLNMAELLTTY